MKKADLLRKKLPPVPTNCPFCQKKAVLNYKEVDVLRGFITDRGKIIGKDRSGICAKHQRKLGQAIRRARYLALLPYLIGV